MKYRTLFLITLVFCAGFLVLWKRAQHRSAEPAVFGAAENPRTASTEVASASAAKAVSPNGPKKSGGSWFGRSGGLHPLPPNADPFMKAHALPIDERFTEVKYQLKGLDSKALNDRMNWLKTLVEADESEEEPHTRVTGISDFALEELSAEKLSSLDPNSELSKNYVHILAEVYESHASSPQPGELLQIAAQLKDSPLAATLQIEANQLNQLPTASQPEKLSWDAIKAENEKAQKLEASNLRKRRRAGRAAEEEHSREPASTPETPKNEPASEADTPEN